MWLDKLLRDIPVDVPQVINDSKTPSGRVHVGSLRGVLIHDAVSRALRERGSEVTFRYGLDDYDPMDGLPHDASDELKQHMGEPLCALPPNPDGGPDFATHYADEFIDLFKPLGVRAEIYRTSDMYRRGDFNEAIAAILDGAAVVREIYERVAGAQRPDDWFPFQAICGRCGKIGATRTVGWDGERIRYRCEPDMVKWAQGCGHEDQISPFDGAGKLPWKLEWAAKWRVLGVTIEGAGKDHCTKGGSRDVAEACLRRIFKAEPPLNIPYEFFLVGGSKMSSSRGIGSSARDMADFLPPDSLRFLMLRSPPQKTVNFSTDSVYISRLFNEYDEMADAVVGGSSNDDQENILRLASPDGEPPATPLPPFQLLAALVRLPHIDIEAEIERRGGTKLDAADLGRLRARIKAARYWLERFAAPEDKIVLCDTLPETAAELGAAQKAFLGLLAGLLAGMLPEGESDEHALQALIFDAARATPLNPKDGFAAIYRVLFDRADGPRGGSVLAWMERDFLIKRFQEPEFSAEDWWRDTAVAPGDALAWLDKNAEAGSAVATRAACDADSGLRAMELTASDRKGKRRLLRILLEADGDEAIRDEIMRRGFEIRETK